MQFGPVPLARARGAVLAHSVKMPGGRLRKGMILQENDLQALAEIGLKEVVVARLEPGDVGEDAAALRLGHALVGPGLRLAAATGGRVNLFATRPGVLAVDRAAVQALNRSDPMITLATLPEWAQVAAGDLVATVKIIAYGVPAAAVEDACLQAAGALRLHPVKLRSASLVQTGMPGALIDKGRRALAGRLDRLGVALAPQQVVAHDVAPLARAMATAPGEVLFILTQSATSDPRDTAPEALRRAGGRVVHFGMPVDPGNLLFIGELGGRPVIGLPGCARSPALNGADWVLARVICGLPVGPEQIAAMGVGGLLKEMPSRPQPRER